MNVESQEVSLEEMWQAIDNFGIDRDKFQKTNPTREQIEAIYHFIKNPHEKRRR